MKPILLMTLEYPPQIGGIAEYLSNIVEGLDNEKVFVLAPELSGAHETDMDSAVPIYRRPLLGRRIRPRWLSGLYWAWWLCRKERPAVLVVSHVLPMGTIARILSRVHKIPYVVIIHGMDIALAVTSGRRKRSEAKRIMSGAAQVVANSRYTAQWARALGVPDERIAVVNPSPSRSLPMKASEDGVRMLRQRHGLQGHFVVLSVGRLVSRKGLRNVIEAVRLLKDRGLPVRYLVVGDGPERNSLEKLARRLGVAEEVRFLGALDSSELAAAYGAADVFIMVPKSEGADVEGFGIVYLEANLFGIPVIGSRSGGVPDAVVHGETGMLVDPGKPDAVADALELLIRDPEFKERLGRQGRQRTIESFSRDMQARRFSSLIERLHSD